MIPARAGPGLGTFRVVHDGPFIAGAKTTVLFQYHVGESGLQVAQKFVWACRTPAGKSPVPPQQRYWDELVQGSPALSPFHPVTRPRGRESRRGGCRARGDGAHARAG